MRKRLKIGLSRLINTQENTLPLECSLLSYIKKSDMETQKKTLGKLKLNKLSEKELENRAMKVLKGGCDCYSVCRETSVSDSANYNQGY